MDSRGGTRPLPEVGDKDRQEGCIGLRHHQFRHGTAGMVLAEVGQLWPADITTFGCGLSSLIGGDPGFLVAASNRHGGRTHLAGRT